LYRNSTLYNYTGRTIKTRPKLQNGSCLNSTLSYSQFPNELPFDFAQGKLFPSIKNAPEGHHNFPEKRPTLPAKRVQI